METKNRPSPEERGVGILLGTAVGDILGAPVEGYSRERLLAELGVIKDFIPSGRGYGNYTDDTEMTLALAGAIIEEGGVKAATCAEKYSLFYSPQRGYGAGAHQVLHALKGGADYRQTGRMTFPDGSFGNGGAMRIAPVGFVYRNAPDDVLYQAVYDAVMCTHVHPEGVDGAAVQARAIALLSHIEDAETLNPVAFLSTLKKIARTAVMRQKMDILMRLVERNDSPEAAILNLGNGIRASEAVPAALFASLCNYKDPEQAVINSVHLGGDADTIGAMCGAHMGALHGRGWIPLRWFRKIENEQNGREAMIDYGKALAKINP